MSRFSSSETLNIGRGAVCGVTSDDDVMAGNIAIDPTEPGWPWTEDDVRAWTVQTAGVLFDTLIDGSTDPVIRRPTAQQLEVWRTEAWTEDGTDPVDLLEEIADTVCAYPFGNAHPRFSAWVNSPPHPLAAMSAGIAAALNPSVAGGNHAAVHLEHQVVRWFCEELGWPTPAGGQFVSGGSAAALTALTVARHHALAALGVDDRSHGLSQLECVPRVYASAEAHSCHIKAVEALGIGSAHITRIPTDAHHRMRPADLDAQLTKDSGNGILPVAVIASAGTVNTGAVDPLAAIADVCTRYDVWFHVDAAYGGPPVLLLDDWVAERAGLARADSVAIDPHKWLYIPVDAGLVLFQNAAKARDTFSLVPDYLRTGGDPAEPIWFSEFGLEQTRPFRALKVWTALKHLGRHRVRNLIARDIAVAAALHGTLSAADDFDVLAYGLSVVCFRHHPAGIDPGHLDDHNQVLLQDVQKRGDAFIAGTSVHGHFALRACIVNPSTTTAHTDALLTEIRAASKRIG